MESMPGIVNKTEAIFFELINPLGFGPLLKALLVVSDFDKPNTS